MLKNKENLHESVLVEEVLEAVKKFAHLNNQVRVIDATLGTGGHTLALAKSGVEVLGIEADQEMLDLGQKRLVKENFPQKGSCKIVQGNFRDIETIAGENNFENVQAVLFDLGVTNLQLMSQERGFSFTAKDSVLDMRINPKEQAVTAADLLNILREDQLKKLFLRILDKFNTGKIVAAIIWFRKSKKIQTVGDFLEICDVIKAKSGLSQATLPFLALRIAVNSELENLEEALPQAFRLLSNAGKLMVITFHSGEEKIVKDFFNCQIQKGVGKITDMKPIVPKENEIMRNPRSRSAKLRILEKVL